MKQKTHIARNNSKIDALNEASRNGHITQQTNEAYLKALEKIYAYESETLYKRDNPQRYIK
jgi:hypothetical protein